MKTRSIAIMAILASCLATAPVHAQQGRVVSRTKPATPAKPAPRKPDLADTLSGSWAGDVISDSKGSSKSDVTLTIERTGPNMIRISSDYPRLPVITVPLERAMTMILNRGGNSTVFYDPTRSPPRLDVSFNNEVSWSGIKQ